MTFNQKTFEAVVNEARQKAAANPRWLNAIDRAVEGLTGKWIIKFWGRITKLAGFCAPKAAQPQHRINTFGTPIAQARHIVIRL